MEGVELKDIPDVGSSIDSAEASTSKILVQETTDNSYGTITIEKLRELLTSLGIGTPVVATLPDSAVGFNNKPIIDLKTEEIYIGKYTAPSGESDFFLDRFFINKTTGLANQMSIPSGSVTNTLPNVNFRGAWYNIHFSGSRQYSVDLPNFNFIPASSTITTTGIRLSPEIIVPANNAIYGIFRQNSFFGVDKIVLNSAGNAFTASTNPNWSVDNTSSSPSGFRAVYAGNDELYMIDRRSTSVTPIHKYNVATGVSSKVGDLPSNDVFNSANSASPRTNLIIAYDGENIILSIPDSRINVVGRSGANGIKFLSMDKDTLALSDYTAIAPINYPTPSSTFGSSALSSAFFVRDLGIDNFKQITNKS